MFSIALNGPEHFVVVPRLDALPKARSGVPSTAWAFGTEQRTAISSRGLLGPVVDPLAKSGSS